MGHARTTRTGAHMALRRALACLLTLALVFSLGGLPAAYGAAALDGAGASATDETEVPAAEEAPEAAAAPSEDMRPAEAATDAPASVKADVTAESSSAPAQIVMQAQKAGKLTVTNQWSGPVVVSQDGKQDVTLQGGSSMTLAVGTDERVVVRESQADATFRSWRSGSHTGLVSGVPCAIASMPAMSAFTTDGAGTTAGDDFFYGFNNYGDITALPAGSFDTTGITTAGNWFFASFNSCSLLSTLPEGSFDTSHITTAGDGLFSNFATYGFLASLPRSFRLPQAPASVGSDYCMSMFAYSSLIKGDQSVPLYFAEEATYPFSGTGITPSRPAAGATVYVNGDPDPGQQYDDPNGDGTAPIVTDVRVLTPEIYRPGILRLEIDVVEEGSGLRLLSVFFESEDGRTVRYRGWNVGEDVRSTFPSSYSGYSGTIAFDVPIREADSVGLYHLTEVYAYDNADNEIRYVNDPGGNSRTKRFPFTPPTLTIKDEFDYKLLTGVNNPTVAKQVADMPEGAAARLSFGGSYGSTLPKGVFDAIRGRDKTVVAYDGQGLRWVFHGKDITEASKDVSLGVGVGTVDGAPYGADGKIAQLTFAPNGELSGKATIRLKSDYLYSMGGVSGTLRLYYVEEGEGGEGTERLVEEDAGFDLVFDGTDKWCHFDVTHNSTFLVSSGPLKVRYSKATFDANGGTVSGKARLVKSVRYGAALGKLPEPTRTGYAFLGWYSAKTGGQRASATTKLTKDITYYARWKASGYVVTFSANGGKLGKAASSSVVKAKGKALGRLPAPTRSGYTFLGWYTGKVKGTEVTAKTQVTKTVTYWAHWKAKGPVLTLNANGGKVGKAATASVVKAKDRAVGRLAVPTRTGYTFQGWFTGKVKGTRVTAATKATRDATLYAHWKAKTYTVKLSANGGRLPAKAASSLKKAHNAKLGKLVTPTRTGYAFQGWYTGKVKGTKVTGNTKATRSVTLYAHWKRVR